jgi:hypothetical protein
MTGEHKNRGAKGCVFGPVIFTLIEHPSPHDMRTGSLESVVSDFIVMTIGFSPSDPKSFLESRGPERPLVDINSAVT